MDSPFAKLKVTELKEQLMAKGLSTKGLKRDLIERLETAGGDGGDNGECIAESVDVSQFDSTEFVSFESTKHEHVSPEHTVHESVRSVSFEPTVHESVRSVSFEPTVHEFVCPEPTGHEPIDPEPTGHEHISSEPTGHEHISSEPTGHEHIDPEPTGHEPIDPEYIGHEHIDPEHIGHEHVDPEPTEQLDYDYSSNDIVAQPDTKAGGDESTHAADETHAKEATTQPQPTQHTQPQPRPQIRLGTKVESSIVKISNFVRPFTLDAAQLLVGQYGLVTTFWMDRLRTVAFVEYDSVEAAQMCKFHLAGLQWPERTGKQLEVEFSSAELMNAVMNAPTMAANNAAPPGPIPTKRSAAHNNHNYNNSYNNHNSDSNHNSDNKTPTPTPTNTSALDELFCRTKARPHIYYLPKHTPQ